MAIGLVPAQCSRCGHVRYMYPSHAAVTKFCSRKCAVAHGAAVDEARFWSQTDRSGECWLWTGRISPGGYGLFTLKAIKTQRANRVAWFYTHKKQIAPGMVVMHRCDNPRCVRPDHLILGTHLDNQHDSRAKGRRPHQKDVKAHALKSASLSLEQVQMLRAIPGRLKKGQREALIRELGVTRATITAVRSGKTWAWL